MELIIDKNGLYGLHDEIKRKLSSIDSNGDYLDSELEQGTYASGYMQALIDVYKLIKK